MTTSASAPPVAVIEHPSRVEWIDTDASGIYHNTTVTRFVEAAEATLMAECGLVDYFPSAPRVRFEVDFESPLVFRQPTTTRLEVVAVGRSSMTFAFEVWGEVVDGRPRHRAARGRYVTVHLARTVTGERVPAPWPAAWIESLREGSPVGR